MHNMPLSAKKFPTALRWNLQRLQSQMGGKSSEVFRQELYPDARGLALKLDISTLNIHILPHHPCLAGKAPRQDFYI